MSWRGEAVRMLWGLNGEYARKGGACWGQPQTAPLWVLPGGNHYPDSVLIFCGHSAFSPPTASATRQRVPLDSARQGRGTVVEIVSASCEIPRFCGDHVVILWIFL